MKTLATLLAGALALGVVTAGCGESDGDDESADKGGSGGTASGKGGSGGTAGDGSSGKGGSEDKGGSSGSSNSSAGSGAGGEATQCIAEGDDCEPGSSDCCEGACIESSTGEFSGCRPLCQSSDDCDSGCCQQFSDGGGGFCVDAAYCTCVEQDGECGPGVPSMCCEGSTCAITEGPYTCHQICTDPGDCPSECCLPLPNTELSVCAPDTYCL